MNSILQDVKLSCILVYHDIITVSSATFTNHLGYLKSVSLVLCGNDLKLNPSYCSFFRDWLKLLGHKVTTTVIHPMENKLEFADKVLAPSNL